MKINKYINLLLAINSITERLSKVDYRPYAHNNKHKIVMDKFINKLVSMGGYKKLRKDYNQVVIEFFEKHIPEMVKDKDTSYYSIKTNAFICNSYTRIVTGTYGSYIEFTKEQTRQSTNDIIINTDPFYIPDEYKWRYNPKYASCKYYHLTPSKLDDTKIYYQKNTVDYADYKPGMYYVSVYDVVSAKHKIHKD